MDKNEEMLRDEFCKEMTGKSLRKVNLDKYLEQMARLVIENTSQENLVCSMAVGDFTDLDDIIVSTGGFYPDSVDFPKRRAFFTLKFIDEIIHSVLLSTNETNKSTTSLFMKELKKLVTYYEYEFNNNISQ